jgi:hypothetical protein
MYTKVPIHHTQELFDAKALHVNQLGKALLQLA